MSQVATTEEGEGDFNFDAWITQNELESLKDLLIKHNATRPATLSMDTVEFQQFMSDPQLFTQSHMIPKILGAVHGIMMSQTLIKIIVSEEEAEVIDKIDKNIQSLKKTKNQIEKLKEEHPKSIANITNQKLQKIDTTKKKVNKIFDNLCDLLNQRRKVLLGQIEVIQKETNQTASNDEDEKEYTATTQIVSKSNQFLGEQEKIYNNLTSTNDNRLDRKSKIIKMGQNIDETFNQTTSALSKYIETITKQIDVNNKVVVDIDVEIENGVQQKIIKSVNKLGKIINTKYQVDEQKIDRNENKQDDQYEDEEVIINRLKQENKELQKKYEQGKVEQINAKENFMLFTTFSKDDKYRWFYSDDEKESDTSQCVLIVCENPLWVLLKDGTIKKDVTQNWLHLSPLFDNHIGANVSGYQQQFLGSVLNELRLLEMRHCEWKVIVASHELEKAKRLCSKQNAAAVWSVKKDFPQWFIIEINIPKHIVNFDWRNGFEDNDCVKEFKLQVSNRCHEYSNDNGWIDVQSFTSQKTKASQHFVVSINKNVPKSRYWRFLVESSYGGYSDLMYLRLAFV